jgi:threonine/homoserine/homoserine lactone efflux protein
VISLETSSAFFAVSVLLALAPGPDNLFVLMQSAVYGRSAGLLVVLGLCTGLMAHTAAVAVGLAAVLAASETAFVAVKLAGAAYLLALAWQAFRSPATAAPAAGKATPALALYGRGIAMNVTNPKVAIFFLAFLPQFVDPSRGAAAMQIAWLGALFIAATLLTFGAIACFAAALGAKLRQSPRMQRSLHRAAGCVFLGLAARLALAQR